MAFGCRIAVDQLRRGEAGESVDSAEPARRPVMILVVPLFHVTGLVPVMLGAFVAGNELVMMYRWDPERALELIERERVTNLVGVPTQSWDLLESPRFGDFDTSSLVSVGGGGAPMPPQMVERLDRSFSKGRPQLGYGMTETNAYGPGHSGDDLVRKPASTGRAVPIVQIEIRDVDGRALPPGDVGEIWMRGPNLIRGYWRRPEATAEAIVDGWLRTGDVGRVDDEGFLYIQDRLKDMILRGGENVYCAEVEAALYEHPDVHEAAVFGVPHERLGEEVAAAVVPRDGTVVAAGDLDAFLRERLAAFKVPSRWVLADAPLPRSATGKILKRELRDRL
jgi:long-chain acyl-CoA synthetase